MRFKEIINEAKNIEIDDLEANDAPEADADQDKIPNILIQLRKALDVDGNYPITFKDGKKAKLSMEQIAAFVKKYMNAKPDEKEHMQSQGGNSHDGFIAVISAKEKPKFQHKIKGDRYMSHFAGDIDEK
jgi:hypothetical protein